MSVDRLIEMHTPAAASAAAEWWADRLRESAGVVSNKAKFDTLGYARESVEKAVVADFFLETIRRQSHTTADQCSKFQHLLERTILNYLCSDRNHWRDTAGWDDGGPQMHLMVDYGPCSELLIAMREAGVTKNMAEAAGLPCKTDMWISARRVEVCCGIGSPHVEIYGPIWGSTLAERQEFDEKMWEAGAEARKWRDDLCRENLEEFRRVYDPLNPPRWQGPV